MPELNWLYPTQAFAESWAAEEVLDWALHRFDRQIAMASGFGPEGMVLIDMAARLRPDVRVFTLDTGLLFRETYELMHKVENRYGIAIERVQPALSVEEQEALATVWQEALEELEEQEWDALLKKPGSTAFLKQLVEEGKKEHAAGQTHEIRGTRFE